MCPECGAPLVAFELHGIEIDHCVSCGGTWLDRGELGMMAIRAKVKPGGMTEALYKLEPVGPGKGRCPRCNARLKQILVRDEPPLQLDGCPRGHGLYFDKGEMRETIGCFAGSADEEADAVAKFFTDMFKYELEKERGE